MHFQDGSLTGLSLGCLSYFSHWPLHRTFEYLNDMAAGFPQNEWCKVRWWWMLQCLLWSGLGNYIPLHSISHVDGSWFSVREDATKVWIPGGEDQEKPYWILLAMHTILHLLFLSSLWDFPYFTNEETETDNNLLNIICWT